MIRNREALLALEGGWLIIQALEALQDELQESPFTIGSVVIRSGDSSPEGRFDDPVGSLYLRTNQATNVSTPALYVKQSRKVTEPTKGWVLK